MQPEIKAICFPVAKEVTVELFKDSAMEVNSENAYAIVGRIGKRKKVLNFCSEVYKLVENSNVLEPLMPVLEQKFKGFEARVKSTKDAQFFVNVTPTIPTVSPKTEVILPAVSFVNSYDGKIKAQAIGGLVRYMVDEKGRVSVTFSTYLKGLSFVYEFKHSNSAIYSMEEVSTHIDNYITNFETIENQIDLMKAVTIEKPTSAKIEKLIRNLVKGTHFPLKSIDETIQRIEYEMDVFECDLNLWILYNSMNFILENCEADLSQKLRMEADNKIYANILQLFDKKLKVSEPETVEAE